MKFLFIPTHSIRYLLILLLSIIVSACVEKPSITGYNLLNPLDSLVIRRFDSSLDTTFSYHKQVKQSDILGGTRRILVGKSDDLTAYSLIRFSIGISNELRDAIKNNAVTVNSARVKLSPVYKFGDTLAGVFNLKIREVNTYFREYGFTIDSLKSGQYDISNTNIVIRNIDNDTLYYSEIDPLIVLNWYKALVVDTAKKPQGILLEPDPSTTYIKGFASTNAYYVGNPIYLEVVVSHNNKTDTLKYYADADVHVIDKSNSINNNDNFLVLQSGVKEKAFIYFDISSIPKNAIINSAFLRLYLDTLNSRFGTSYQDSLFLHYVIDSSQISLDSALTFVLTKTSLGYYEGQLNFFAQKWIDNRTNRGLLINVKDPEGGVEKFVFYGTKAAIITKRPQLIINYTFRK